MKRRADAVGPTTRITLMRSPMAAPEMSPALLLLLAIAAAPAHSAVHLNWVSHNGAAALLAGGPFTATSKVTLVSSSTDSDSATTATTTTTTVPALDVSNAALKFRVPGASQAYDVSVDGSAPLCMNLPDPWWWQGDAGNSSTPDGWLRVFGRSIGLSSGTALKSTAELQADAAAAIARADYATAGEVLRRLQQSGAAASTTQLRLTPSSGGGEPVIIAATNTTEHDAFFEIPSSLALGSYTGELSNGLSTVACGTWRPLSMFLRPDPQAACGKSPPPSCDPTPQPCPAHASRTFCMTNNSAHQCDNAPAPCPPCPAPKPPPPGPPPPPVCPAELSQPAVPIHSTITIASPHKWDPTVFEVDCDWEKPLQQRSCGWYGARATTQLDDALAKARAHGGGIVHLRAGVYFIDGPLKIPDGVHLRGESIELVSIFFREVSSDAQSIGALVSGDSVEDGTEGVKPAESWAMTDLAIYVSGYYSTVVDVAPECGRFRMQRVRVRAAAYFGLQCNENNLDQVFEKQHGEKPRMCSSRGRYANFTIGQGNSIVELGGQNFEITDCDLLGTATILHTGGGSTGQRGCSSCAVTSTERYGVIARNLIWNANAAHWFDNAHEIIFEHNIIQPAGTAPAWGNNIDNYARGYSQHLFFGYNQYRQVWTGDREILTLDPLYGSYTGGVVAASNVSRDDKNVPNITNATQGKILLLDMCSHCHIDTGDLGGAATIIDGTGAGQYRRIVSAGARAPPPVLRVRVCVVCHV